MLFVLEYHEVGFRISTGCSLRVSPQASRVGPVVQVEEISLQTCILKRWDGARVWYPNIIMLSAPVTNITRSGCKWECFTVSPQSKICLHVQKQLRGQ